MLRVPCASVTSALRMAHITIYTHRLECTCFDAPGDFSLTLECSPVDLSLATVLALENGLGIYVCGGSRECSRVPFRIATGRLPPPHVPGGSMGMAVGQSILCSAFSDAALPAGVYSRCRVRPGAERLARCVARAQGWRCMFACTVCVRHFGAAYGTHHHIHA